MRKGTGFSLPNAFCPDHFYRKIKGICWWSWFRKLYRMNILDISNYQYW